MSLKNKRNTSSQWRRTEVKATKQSLKVVTSRGQHCGDIELAGYLANTAGPVPLVLDLRLAHDRFGSSSNPDLNGKLHIFPGYIRRNDEIVSELDLSYNVITVHEAKELAELIAHPLCRVPVTLSLRGCGIPDEGTAAIFQGLSINTSITALDLTNLALGHFGVSSLSKTLSENSTLTKINVWGCGLGAHRAKHLFEGLSENRGLKKLDLGNNDFGNIGLQHLEVS
jgi:hypothetical protein